MSYVKNNWKNGDVISADKLNHMEDGISSGGGAMIVGGTWGEIKEEDWGYKVEFTADKTWEEISQALQSGTLCIFSSRNPQYPNTIVARVIEGAYYSELMDGGSKPYVVDIPFFPDGVLSSATPNGALTGAFGWSKD